MAKDGLQSTEALHHSLVNTQTNRPVPFAFLV